MPETFDTIVVGGGPAGCGTAVWLARLGYRPLLLEKAEALGGLQRRSPYPNDWLVGWHGRSGQDLARSIAADVERAGVTTRLKARILELTSTGHAIRAAYEAAEGRRTAEAPALVIATGARPRSGGFRASADVLIGPGEAVARLPLAGRRIAILGGGDNAFENYLFLRERATREGRPEALHLYARRPRARADFLKRVEPRDLRLGPYQADGGTRTVEGRDYDTLIVLYGWAPGDTFAGPLDLETDAEGFLAVDGECRTSRPEVHAVGEVARRLHPCVATALADGATAAKSIQARLEPVRLANLAAGSPAHAELVRATEATIAALPEASPDAHGTD